jgi:hypothetical protein
MSTIWSRDMSNGCAYFHITYDGNKKAVYTKLSQPNLVVLIQSLLYIFVKATMISSPLAVKR